MALVRRVSEPVTEDRRSKDRDTDGLLDQLGSDNPEERRRATLDLWGVPAAIPPLLDAWPGEPSGATREAMLTVLAGHDDPHIAGSLAARLRDDDVAVRNAAVKALQAMPEGFAAVAGDLLRDPDADVRVLAVMVLSELPHPQVPGWLTPLVHEDDDANVVAAAIDVALTLGGDLAAALAPVAVRRFPDNPYLHFLAGMAARR